MECIAKKCKALLMDSVTVPTRSYPDLSRSSVFYFLHDQAWSVRLTVPYAPTYLVEGRKSRFISRCSCLPSRTDVQLPTSIGISTRTRTSTCKLLQRGDLPFIQSRSRRKRKHANQGCEKSQAKLPRPVAPVHLVVVPCRVYFWEHIQ